MVTKRINVPLNEEEYAFVKWLAKRDGVSISDELYLRFYVEFERCKIMCMDEFLKWDTT